MQLVEILRIVRDDKRQSFRGRWDWPRRDDPSNDALDFDLIHPDE
jgi:hypothetical protein